MPKLGLRLRKAREMAGLSQLEAAKKLGISNGTLSGYERDYRDPDTRTLEKIANLYEVSVDWLLGLSDDPAPRSHSSSHTPEDDVVGARIKRLRQERGWSLRELERRTGIHYSYLNRIENNKAKPNIEHLEILAKLFNVHISYFFGELIETPDELKDLVDWIALSKELKEKGLTPEQVKQIVEFARKIKEV